MNRRTILITALIAFLAIGMSTLTAGEREIDWKHVSKNLVKALASDNDGLRQSAMVLIVRHSDKLQVNDAVYDVMHIYRTHKDERVKQLALATLHKMESRWAIGFLRMDLKFQESEKLRRMVAAILQDYDAKKADAS